MRKLKTLWLGIPRPCRAALNILAILILLSTFYVSIYAPPLSAVQAFRREERANLVGPSTILFSEAVDGYNYDHLILAETEHGVITYVQDSWNGFNYHEKTGDITIVSAPKWWFNWGSKYFDVSLPVFIVDDHPDAVRANLKLDIQGFFIHNTNGERYEEPLDHHFDLESRREEDGFFFFSIDLPYVDPYDEYGNDTGRSHGSDGYALDALAQTFTNNWNITSPQSTVSITATMQLYDANDQMITEQELILRTMSDNTETDE